MRAGDEHVTDLSVLVEDVDEMEQALPALPMEIRRLGAGGAVGFHVAQLGETGLLTGEFGFPVVTEGAVADGYCMVALLSDRDGHGHWNGAEFDPGRAFVYGPGTEHLGVGRVESPDRPLRWIGISIPVARLSVAAARGDGVIGTGRVVDDRSVGTLRALCWDVLHATGRGATSEQRRLAERDIVDLVAALEDVDDLPSVERSAAQWAVDECLELADELGPTASAADLAAGVGVSDRWLRAAFGEVYGVSTTAYFRARALDAARRDLLAGHPPETSVTEIAMRWGFWHLGRFSGMYRDHFGELPSATLAR